MAKNISVFIIVLFVISLVVLIGAIGRFIKVLSMRKKGVFPKKGMESPDDIENLLRIGERNLAIYCHRLVHKTSLRDAIKQVRHIEQNLK